MKPFLLTKRLLENSRWKSSVKIRLSETPKKKLKWKLENWKDGPLPNKRKAKKIRRTSNSLKERFSQPRGTTNGKKTETTFWLSWSRRFLSYASISRGKNPNDPATTGSLCSTIVLQLLIRSNKTMPLRSFWGRMISARGFESWTSNPKILRVWWGRQLFQVRSATSIKKPVGLWSVP